MGSTSSVSNPITFNGSSTYSSSFQQVLQRAVSIASLPMQQVQGEVTTLQSQQADLSNMQATFSSLQNSLQDVASAMSGSVSASSSNPAVVSASAASSTLPGTYSIEVDDTGSSTSTISNADLTTVTDPTSQNISSSLDYTLTVNDTPQTITLTSDTLDALATAINGANAGVSATIVNLGSNASPDYRLALTSTELGGDTIQLNDGTNDLLTNVQTGTDAQYIVNGNGTTLTGNSDQVTLAPGLTATLVSPSPGNTVNITVAASDDALSTALSNFATAYNAAVSAISNEHGQSGGALAGESLVYTLGDALSQITQYVTGSGAVQDLSDLGLDLDSTGNLSFNSTQFSSQGAAGIQQFLGGIASGGFLQTANNALSAVADPTSGALTEEISSVANEITNDNSQISDDQANVNNMQAALQAQLSAADAAIAVLQQQQTFYTNLFQTENANNMAGLT
jgi:flagellar hook-associated protein 2